MLAMTFALFVLAQLGAHVEAGRIPPKNSGYEGGHDGGHDGGEDGMYQPGPKAGGLGGRSAVSISSEGAKWKSDAAGGRSPKLSSGGASEDGARSCSFSRSISGGSARSQGGDSIPLNNAGENATLNGGRSAGSQGSALNGDEGSFMPSGASHNIDAIRIHSSLNGLYAEKSSPHLRHRKPEVEPDWTIDFHDGVDAATVKDKWLNSLVEFTLGHPRNAKYYAAYSMRAEDRSDLVGTTVHFKPECFKYDPVDKTLKIGFKENKPDGRKILMIFLHGRGGSFPTSAMSNLVTSFGVSMTFTPEEMQIQPLFL